MKIGKVSQTILKRSMIKPLQFQREESLLPVTAEEMCYGIRAAEGEEVLLTDVALSGNEKDLGVFALAHVVNHLATRGAQAVGVSVRIILPPYAYETRLKSMMEHIDQTGSRLGIQVLSAKAEVSSAVSQAVVMIQGVGLVKKGALLCSSMAKPEQDMVLLGRIGLEGTLRILNEKEEELKERFVPSFLKQLHCKQGELFVSEIIKEARQYGVSAMHQIAGGGILAGLWELGEAAGVGMEVVMKQMTICQETVEICEYYHLNPYQLTSAGCVLITTDRGEELTEYLLQRGYAASLLGRTTEQKARVILGGEEKRFLDRPAPDELNKIYE